MICVKEFRKKSLYKLVVFLEKSHGYGGSLAAPIARQCYEYLYPEGWDKKEEVKPHA